MQDFTLLLQQLKRHEGAKRFVYRDHLGYETIGVGRCLVEGVGIGLSEEEINYLLENDVKRCYKELSSYSWFLNLDSVRQQALINMCFNLGLSRLLKFKNMINALSNHDYEEASKQALQSKWAQQVGNRAIEISEIIRSGNINF